MFHCENGDAVSSSSSTDVGVHTGLGDLKPETYLFVCSGSNGDNAASDAAFGHARRHAQFDGDFLTCGGGAAATEMMISIIAQD